DGAGGLSPLPQAELPGLLYEPAIAVADATGDGRPDILAAEKMSMLLVLRGDGVGGVQSMASLAPAIDVDPWPGNVNLVDFDGDGHLDLLDGEGTQPVIQLRHGDGTGGLGAPTDIALSPGFGALKVILVDMDKDGALDLLVSESDQAGFGGGKLSLLRGDGSGGFLPGVDIAGIGAESQIDVADMDGDGDLDLVTAIAGSTLAVWLSDG